MERPKDLAMLAKGAADEGSSRSCKNYVGSCENQFYEVAVRRRRAVEM